MSSFPKICIKYWNTIRYLRFVQIVGRVKFQLWNSKVVLSNRNSRRTSINHWVKPAPRSQKMISKNTFKLLNEIHTISDSDWNNKAWSKLWIYNLHYFDDLNSHNSNQRRDWHFDLIDRWINENKPGLGFGWNSYPTSLRIVNWIKWSLDGNSFKERWTHSLEIQARFLSKRIEHHLMGNHIFANAKALIFAGLFFDGSEAKKWYSKGCKIISKELKEQILDDGGHFELSPMYHIIFLEDLLDLVNIHRVYNYQLPSGLEKIIESMFCWLRSMCHPDGEISFFNDAALEISPSVIEIKKYGNRLKLFSLSDDLKPKGFFIKLEASGYSRVELDNLVALIDRANIGPDYLPAHGHADTLSFELSLFGSRVIVNSGTSLYGENQARQYQRSTKSHSTLVIDDENSSEVWSGFRVARRAKVSDVKESIESGKIILSACHNGYHRLYGKPTHFRQWYFIDRLLEIQDRVTGNGNHKIELVFPLHPDIELKDIKENKIILGLFSEEIKVEFYGEGLLSVEKSSYYPEFGLSIENNQLLYELIGPLPIDITTRISW